MKYLKIFKALVCSGLIISSCFLSGCSKDPLQILKSDLSNNELGYQFWLQQYKQNTPLWHKAVQYCIPNEDKPNCKDVLGLYFFGDGHQKAPLIGHSGESIHLDK